MQSRPPGEQNYMMLKRLALAAVPQEGYAVFGGADSTRCGLSKRICRQVFVEQDCAAFGRTPVLSTPVLSMPLRSMPCAKDSEPEQAFPKHTSPEQAWAKDTSAEDAFPKHTEKPSSGQDDFCYIFPRLTELEAAPLYTT